MDGGVDRALAGYWPGVQRSVWAAIADEYHGYLPVGAASVVPTGGEPCRWLVYAPTMRVPMPLSGELDIAVHNAFWAGLLAIGSHPAAGTMKRLAAPGFGTGFGRVSTPAGRPTHGRRLHHVAPARRHPQLTTRGPAPLIKSTNPN